MSMQTNGERTWLACILLLVLCAGAMVAAVQRKPHPMPGMQPPVRVVHVSLGEPGRSLVGPYVNAESLRRALELIDLPSEGQSKPILVLDINSIGGMLREVPRFSDLIEFELKPKYRVVVWVHRAESAAALIALNSSEIFMRPGGTLGGAVTFTAEEEGPRAIEGAELERALIVGAEVARRGGYDPLVVRAMQDAMTLSCDVDEQGGVVWYADDRGDSILCTDGRILTFNSSSSWRFGVSKGRATSLEQILQVLGIEHWVEVGERADAYLRQERQRVFDAWTEVRRITKRIRSLRRLSQRVPLEPSEIQEGRELAGRLRLLVDGFPEIGAYDRISASDMRSLEEVFADPGVETSDR